MKKQTNKDKNQPEEAKGESGFEELEAQIAELNTALLRERADAANVRRRAEDEKIKLGSFYKALVVKELLPVVDNFERALKAAPDGKLDKGVESIFKQFAQALKKLGVEPIKTVGEHFDPNTMEAVIMEEGDGEHEIVSEELQSGYKMNEELLRPAMVRVRS